MYTYLPYDKDVVESSNKLKEANDCTVKAFAKVFNTTYERAHKHLKDNCGRKNKKGIVSREVIPQSLKNTRFAIGPYTRQNRVTLKKFCEEHKEGRFYVSLCGHAVAVIDGVVYDHSDKPRRQVTWAMRVYLEVSVGVDRLSGENSPRFR